MSEDIKNGDMVMCRYTEDSEWGGPFYFIGIMPDGRFAVFNEEESWAEEYSYCKKVPEKTYRPFTQETFPKGFVWFKHKGTGSIWLLSGILKTGVVINTYEISYKELLEEYTMSFDQETWVPAGVEE